MVASPDRIGRRDFLQLSGAALIATQSLAGRARAAGPARWSDPRTWAGQPPGRHDTAIISRPVLLDVDARVAGVAVEHSGKLIFDPARSRTLKSTGNVVINGVLEMRPRKASVEHRLVFQNVDESRFRGGGHEVVPTDVGLWVMHGGSLDLEGASKQAWARAAGGVSAGATTIELDRDLEGWRSGDEVVITPTGPPTDGGDSKSFDSFRITAVSGRAVTLDGEMKFDHPALEAGEAPFTAEVLNLTRNVSIEGTRRGRAHVFIHSLRPQSIRNTVVRHVGPRRNAGPVTLGVLGRYAIHFHHSYGGSRGSKVENVVVRDSGNHSFVPHTSHGVTFRGCVAHDVIETPFWWDEGDRTDDVLWEDCVAARVTAANNISASDLTGFFLGRGEGNTVRRCIATGVRGEKTASGFQWPQEPADGLWTFEDCLAHNNKVNAIFVWQKNERANVVSRFTAYHNGAGILHGSFANSFRYSDLLLVANGRAHILLHANSAPGSDGRGLRFEGVTLDGRGITPVGVEVSSHLVGADLPVQFDAVAFSGLTEAPVRYNEVGGKPGRHDFIRCSTGAEARDLQPSDFERKIMAQQSVVRVQYQDDSQAYSMDYTGAVQPIPPFATE